MGSGGIRRKVANDSLMRKREKTGCAYTERHSSCRVKIPASPLNKYEEGTK